MSNKKKEILLEIKDLHIEGFSDEKWHKIINGVDLKLYKGEVLGVIGESGAGKSTLGLASMGYTQPGCRITGGQILFDGVDLVKLSESKKRKYWGDRMTYVAQSAAASFNPAHRLINQTTDSTIRAGLKDRTIAFQDARRLYEALNLPDADKIGERYPHQVSGGQLQRVMTAMAMSPNPDLIIFDEPTTALDVTIQAQILDLMMELKDKRDDAAILLITHDLAVIAETCDRVIVMYGGVIQEIAPIDELFKNPVHPYTKALMESIPKMDIKEKRLKALKGMVPSILELDDGCKLCSRFDPEECACKGTKFEPELIKISDGHFARVNLDVQ